MEYKINLKHLSWISGAAGLGLIVGLFFISLASFSIRGIVFEDKNGNGSKDVGEGGVTGRTVSLAKTTLFESVNVVVNDANGINTVNLLVNGRRYLFVASGEWNGCDNPWWCGLADGSEDAEWHIMHRSDWPTHNKDGTLGYAGSSTNQGDLMINDTFVEWGPYRSDHVYSYVFTGTGGAVNFSVMDGLDDVKIPAFYGDNSFLGIPPAEHLKVDIYELVDGGGIINPVTTDAGGNYVFSGVSNGDYQIIEQQVRGWIPTNPASGTHDVTVAGDDIVEKNFGNQQEAQRFNVSKTVLDLNGGDAMPDDELEYTIFFDNVAPVKYLYGIDFNDILPSGLTYVPASAQILSGLIGARDCMLNAGTFSIVGGTLSATWDSYDDPFAPGKSACFRFKAKINNDVPTNGVVIDNKVDVTTLDAGAGAAETAICVPFCLQRRRWPTNYSISINNGDECTASSEVSLTLRAEETKSVVISNDKNFIGAEWEPFTNPMVKNWNLGDGDGIKTVYAIFKSMDNNTSFPSPVSESIELRQAGCEQEPSPQFCGNGICEIGENSVSCPVDCPLPPEETCEFDCHKVTYDLYIINPDGTIRDAVSSYAKVESLGADGVAINFEDKGSDWDFDDVRLKIDRSDCNKIVVTSDNVDAGWHHQIGVVIFYDDVFKKDLPLWPDSHTSVGESKIINLNEEVVLCSDKVNF